MPVTPLQGQRGEKRLQQSANGGLDQPGALLLSTALQLSPLIFMVAMQLVELVPLV